MILMQPDGGVLNNEFTSGGEEVPVVGNRVRLWPKGSPPPPVDPPEAAGLALEGIKWLAPMA
jgi:hypothetical protein